MPTLPRVIGRSFAYQGYMTVEKIEVCLTDGAHVIREVETHGDAVAVLPYNPERRVALTVRLFRTPAFDRFGQVSLQEACAGMIDAGEAPEAAARREVLEELGLQIDDLEPVGQVWPSPGVSSERVSLFLAIYQDGDRSGEGGGVDGEHEGIEVIESSLTDLAGAADAGRIEDLKLLTLVLSLRSRQPDLFLARQTERKSDFIVSLDRES